MPIQYNSQHLCITMHFQALRNVFKDILVFTNTSSFFLHLNLSYKVRAKSIQGKFL